MGFIGFLEAPYYFKEESRVPLHLVDWYVLRHSLRGALEDRHRRGLREAPSEQEDLQGGSRQHSQGCLSFRKDAGGFPYVSTTPFLDVFIPRGIHTVAMIRFDWV